MVKCGVQVMFTEHASSCTKIWDMICWETLGSTCTNWSTILPAIHSHKHLAV